MGKGRIKGITVEIGGDTTKLTTALKDVDNSLSQTQKSLRDVNRLLKLDPGNTELLVQKQKLLSDAINETKERLATLRTAAEQANAALARGDMSQTQYDALQREIVETEQKLKSLEEQASKSSVALQKIGAVGDTLQNVGDKVSGVGSKITKSVTAPVAGLGTAAVATAANFESSMSQVQATMGLTKDSMSQVDGQSVNTMDTLSALAEKMGRETAFSASECAEALNYLALAGYDTQEMCDTLPTVLNLAAAGGIDLASASDMVTDAMSALGMKTKEADVMVDQMAKTSSTTNTSVAQLGEGILKIGATAKSIQGGTAELNTALGILANNGIKGAEGGTHLRNIILSLQSPTDKAAAQMKRLGVEVYDSEGNMRSLNDILGDLNTSMEGMTSAEKDNIINQIFNTTDIAAVNSLLANTGETWDNLQTTIIESSGAAQQMADTQLDNLQGQLTILKSALEGLAISIGRLLLPIIKDIVAGIQGFVDWLNSLDEGTKKVIVTIGLVAAAVGPVLVVIGKVIAAVGTILKVISKIGPAISVVKTAVTGFISVFSKMGPVISVAKTAITGLFAVLSANPIGLVVAAVAGLIAIFVTLWNKCEWFRDMWIGLWENVKAVTIAVWEGLKSFFQGIWESISSLAQTIWGGITAFLSGIWDGVRNVAEVAWNGIGELLSSIWQGICTVAQTIWGGIADFFSGLWENIKAIAKSAWNSISTLLSTVWTTISTIARTIWNGIRDFLSNIWEGIKNVFSAALETIKNIVSSAWEAIKNITVMIITSIGDFLRGAWESIKEVIFNAFEAIKEVVSAAWETVEEIITKAMDAIKEAVTVAWNAVKDAILTVMESIKTAITAAWEAIKTAILAVMDSIKEAITAAWEAVKTAVTNIVNSIKETVTAIWESIKNAVAAIMERMKETVIKAWNGLKTAVTNVVNVIKETVTSVFSKFADGVKSSMTKVLDAVKNGFKIVKDHVMGIAKEAIGWGKDMIMGIVKGIKGAVGHVKDAVVGVGDTIRSFLHFSVPDEGPLTDYETWMPDFMKGLAKGIEKSRGLLRSAVENVAEDLTFTPTIAAVTNNMGATINGGRMEIEKANMVHTDSALNSRIDAMYEVVTKYLPKLANRQIILDSGALVGELSDGMNRKLGREFL